MLYFSVLFEDERWSPLMELCVGPRGVRRSIKKLKYYIQVITEQDEKKILF